MKTLRVLFSLIFLTLFFSCQNDLTFDDQSQVALNTNDSGFNEEVKIAILSDIHVMAPSLLGQNGSAFQSYLNKDPKLLEFSSRILHAAVCDIISQKPDLVLISGDLTKDGEKVSHETVIRILNQLTSHGIKVLVTIGNHDVNNPEAVKFINDRTVPVPTVQASSIPSLYAKFGFNDAISRDPNSLSYVNEPIDGLWILTIDANEYYNNTTKSIWNGVIKPETMSWVKEQLAEAQNKGKTVIGMMHHGLVEHYYDQNMIDPGYVVDNYTSAADTLIDAGLKIILTGHYHATDITKREHNGKFIFDVETGSTAAYPCTYRMLTINGNEYSFKPQRTTNLMGSKFDVNARNFLSDHLDVYFYNLLMNGFGVPAPYAKDFAPFYKAAAMAHFAGDEVFPATINDQFNYLNAVDDSGTLSGILGSLWTDINTIDNTVTIDLSTGIAE